MEIRKAKVEISLGQRLVDTYIAVDGVAAPYRSLSIISDFDGTKIKVSRTWGDDHIIRSELYDDPIEEILIPYPLILHIREEDEPIPDRLKYKIGDFLGKPKVAKA